MCLTHSSIACVGDGHGGDGNSGGSSGGNNGGRDSNGGGDNSGDSGGHFGDGNAISLLVLMLGLTATGLILLRFELGQMPKTTHKSGKARHALKLLKSLVILHQEIKMT